MRPFLVSIEVETEIKIFSKLNKASHFVDLQDFVPSFYFLCFYWIVSTVVDFRLGGPETRLKRGALMMSSYSATVIRPFEQA